MIAIHEMGDNNSVYSKAESDAHHRRGYQACDPCRKRKVKCDLGSMDSHSFSFCGRTDHKKNRCR